MGIDYDAQVVYGIEVGKPRGYQELKYEMHEVWERLGHEGDPPIELVSYGSMQCGPECFIVALKEHLWNIDVKYDSDKRHILPWQPMTAAQQETLQDAIDKLGLTRLGDGEPKAHFGIWVS